MEFMKILKYSLILFFASSILIACGDDEEDTTPTPTGPGTIADIAAGDDQFSTLVDALARVDLVTTLQGDGPFTVFAPTNAAFEALGVDLNTLSDEDLTEILLYHVIPGEVASTDLPEGQLYASTASATGPNGAALSILVERSGTTVTVNNAANVSTPDVDASNGVIHIVDAVILPLDVVGHASANANYSSLVGAVDGAGLVPTLQGDGPFTVFAPDNDAFAQVDLSGLSQDEITNILLYHVLGGAVASTDLQDGNTYAGTANTTGPDDTSVSMLIQKSGDGVRVNDAANVAVADIVATNGIIHAIDAVILPLDVVGHASANSDFSELVNALGVAEGNLVATLQGDGPFTVFAPVNSAFEDIAAVVAGLTPAELRDVLLYHVVGGANVLSSTLSDGQVVTTVNTGEFTVNVGTEVTITDAQGGTARVVFTDVQATNGVIHVLDKVLLP
jgi:transforming growth factor-beta-induced protein